MRRSLPATSRASRHIGVSGPHGLERAPPAAALLGDLAAGHDHHPVGQRDGQVGLVGGEQHRRAALGGLGHQLGQRARGPRRRGRRGARRAARAPAPGPPARPGPPAGAGRPRAGPRRSAGGARRRPAGRAPRRPSPPAARRPGWRTGRSRPPSARRRGGRRGPAGPPGHGPRSGPATRSQPSTTASPEVTDSRPAQARRRLVLPAPFGPRTTTTSPGATVRSTPERAGNRPASATAARRWTAGAMAWRPCYGGRGARGQAGPRAAGPGRRRAASARGQPVQAQVVEELAELRGQPAQLAGQRRCPEGHQDGPGHQVDHPQGAPGPGEQGGEAAEGHPGERKGTPRPIE